MSKGTIVKVAGPLVIAEGMRDANMFDVVRVSQHRLIGEIIEMHGDRASIQVYEETSGLGPGEPVESTDAPLSVELGPGLISSIFDGIQRPLEAIVQAVGNNLERGVEVPALNREAKWHFVPTVKAGDTVVPGDIIVLGEGDSVSADGRLFAAASLRIAEASLTGESVPVGKKTDTLAQAKALGDRANMVFNGTSVTQGTGRAIVTSTGMGTQVGKIADLLQATEDDETPLQKEMNYVSKILGSAVCIIAVVVLVALALTEGFQDVHDVIDSLLLAVSLAVAAVPEGLAAILTVVLALGVQRMAMHNAIVKKLHSVETLGSASVICSDKTGTLTRNEMTVERVVTPSGEVQLTGTGYAPEGRMVVDPQTMEHAQIRGIIESEAVATLAVGALANDGELRESAASAGNAENVTWEAVGDPTEVSLIVAARKVKANRKYANYERVGEIPFTSERKRMSIVAQDNADAGRLTVFSKGAPDVLLGYCSRIAVGGAVRPLTEGDRQQILATVEQLSSDAYRTLGQAYRPLGTASLAQVPGIMLNSAGHVADIAEQSDVLENDLIWVGMVGIIDPPRTEVRDSVAEAHRAGIRTVMITGDHPLTAARIATDLGIIDKGGKAMTGSQLDEGSSNNSFTYELNEGTLAANYIIETKEGELTVKPILTEITITANSGEKMYDGSALINGGYTFTSGILVDGDVLTAVVEGSQLNAGSSANVVKSYRVMRGETDVTANYRFAESVDGKLTVTARKVVMTSADDEKVYDGTPLTNDEITVTGDGFIEGEGVTYDVTGSQLDVGSSDNSFTYKLNEGTLAENYIIETEEGKLTVTSPEQHIVITANSAEKTYDGTPLTDDGFTYTDFVLAEGDVLEAVVEGSQTDAGSSVNVIKSYRVMRGDEDVTANYIFDDSVDGTLTVTKRKVTLTSGTACKIYDGKYLTCNKVEVGGDGFVEGEGATYDVTGKRKDIGWSYNDFTYTLNDNTKADNYEITVERGFLYVKDQAEKPKTGDSSDLLLLLALMSMSGAGAAGTVYLYRRKREEQE